MSKNMADDEEKDCFSLSFAKKMRTLHRSFKHKESIEQNL